MALRGAYAEVCQILAVGASYLWLARNEDIDPYIVSSSFHMMLNNVVVCILVSIEASNLKLSSLYPEP